MENQVHNEDATKQQIERLLSELTFAQQSYDEWRTSQPSDLDQKRSAWLSIRDRQHMYDADVLRAWKAQEPGLASKPEIIAVKQKIASLQSELAVAQAELVRLVDLGTPFEVYKRAVDGIESMIGGIVQRLRKGRIEAALVSTYGHSNFAKLPRAMTDAARLHPSVVEVDIFAFHPKLAKLRESQITGAVVDNAATNAGEALVRLRELVSDA